LAQSGSRFYLGGSIVTDPERDYRWLPDHQLHVVSTVAHVDKIIDQIGILLASYTRSPGCLELENVRSGDEALVRVAAINPLPLAVGPLIADGLTQLRAAIEHVLFVEVESQLGRSLTPKEARTIEMPAAESAAGAEDWFTHKTRKTLAPLQRSSKLAARIRDLQPYHRRDSGRHPLRVLVEHTNRAKHRAPVVAATLLGAVIPDVPSRTLWTESGSARPIAVGDVLARGPAHERVPISIWPKVSLQRPHAGTWHVVMHELRELEEWVREVAIPHLILGRSNVSPLPPGLNTSIGYVDIRSALTEAVPMSAADRNTIRMQAEPLRAEFVEILLADPNSPDQQSITAWIDKLSDSEVISKFERIAKPSQRRDARGLRDALHELSTEIRLLDGSS